MREIPSLQSLCFRSVGSQACSTEDAFCPVNDEHLSFASRLLRSYHSRQMTRIPCIGLVRRENANQVDLHHPFVGARTREGLVAQHGNPALDVLQSYIDALVEMGRMDDRRLGKRFFEEYKANIQLGNDHEAVVSPPDPKKARRSSRSDTIPLLASLSLYNCSVGRDTLEALIASGLPNHLAVLDLTGVNGLTDDLCRMVLEKTTHLERFSVKNCRRISIQALKPLARSDHLACLDVGGCFNVSASELLEHILPFLPALTELHASGLGWTDATVGQLSSLRKENDSKQWRGLSFGFSLASPTQNLTAKSLREDMVACSHTLRSLALPFCETLVDNALLGMLGRNFPALGYLDLRGNPALQTVTGWYDGRASADLPPQPLTVLGRYTSMTASSVEDTKRIHPLETVDLVVILDAGGMGAAIPSR